jgi:predicted  nucleic acid-binding Zn-ribbon protein
MPLPRLILGVPALAISCAVALALPGCGTREKSENTNMSQEVQQLQAEIDDLHHQIDTSTSALNLMLVTRSGSDLKQDYHLFVESSQHIDQRADNLAKHTAKMREHREAYLDDWNRNIQSLSDPSVKQTQQERLREVEEHFDQVTQQVDDLHTDLGELRKKMGDLRIAFQYDLTSNGVKAMSDHIQATQDDAASVQEKLNDASKKLAQWAGSLRPTA